MYDSNYWRWMNKIIVDAWLRFIVDEWLRFFMRFIEDEWFKLLQMNDWDLLKMCDSDYCGWMIKIFHEISWRWMIIVIVDEWSRFSMKFIEDEWFRFICVGTVDEWLIKIYCVMKIHCVSMIRWMIDSCESLSHNLENAHNFFHHLIIISPIQ